jgi:hypothetical protein
MANAAHNEPSMEDILASIRRILADDAGSTSDPAAPASAPVIAPSKPGRQQSAPSPPQAMPPADDPEPEGMVEWEEEAVPPARQIVSGERDMADNVLQLTPEMRIAGPARMVSPTTLDASTDVLSHLAKAILDRRDIAIGARDVTIEGMVREMLRPLLKEWLDRNLPYLIERLVKREIDLMVNRAERLDD